MPGIRRTSSAWTCPGEELGDEPDDKYRRAARIFAAWRSDGTFHKDPRPAIYVYDQTYRPPGGDGEVSLRGYFARVRLEPFGEGGILPHERTLAAPREDRYRLLRATGANMSPVEMLYEDPSGRAAALLAAIVEAPAPGPVADVTDADHVRHRLWVVPARPATADEGTGAAEEALPADPASELIGLAASGPLTIADGHHRYETALRYRDERRMSRSCEEDPAFDYVLALLVESTGQTLTVLPTHRLVGGLDAVRGPAGHRAQPVRRRAASPAGTPSRRPSGRPTRPTGTAAAVASGCGRAPAARS